MDSRLEYPVPFKYSDRVLLENWVYRRINKEPQEKGDLTFASTYRNDYYRTNIPKPDKTALWDQIMQNEDSNFISEHDRMDYANFTSLYDLSYNHFPKCFPANIGRTWRMIRDIHEPIDEYLTVQGNRTQFGLLKQKNYDWEKEKDDPRITSHSHYQCAFKPPPEENYKFKRFFVPPLDTENLTQEEIETFKEKRKFRAKHEPIYSTQMDAYKNAKYRNPITWECLNEAK